MPRNTEIDDGGSPSIDNHVAGFEITMNDPLSPQSLDRFRDVDDHRTNLGRRQSALHQELVERQARSEKIPLSETRNYVQRVLENAVVYEAMYPKRAIYKGANPLSFFLGKRYPG